MKTIIRSIGFVCVTVLMMIADNTWAQQDPLYTQYMFNKLVFNPACAGSNGYFEASLDARTQWTGVNGAPETQTLIVHSPIKNSNMGTGLSVVNDVAGPLTQRNAMAYYSYGVKFSSKDRLTFGLNAGIYTISANLPGVELADNEYDPAFSDVYENAAKFNVGFGMYYNTGNYYVGVSAPKLYNSSFLGNKDRAEIDLKNHYYLLGGAKFRLSDNVYLRPSILARKVSGAPVGIDLSALVEMNEKYWGGFSGRWEDGVSIIVGGMITENFRLGYSFDASLTTMAKVSSGSHELFISYELPLKTTSNPLLR